jgi:pilus assembly protein Flp/PilA
MTRVLRFLADESGATAIEYAIIAGGVSIVILAAVQSLGIQLDTIFTSVSSGFK